MIKWNDFLLFWRDLKSSKMSINEAQKEIFVYVSMCAHKHIVRNSRTGVKREVTS